AGRVAEATAVRPAAPAKEHGRDCAAVRALSLAAAVGQGRSADGAVGGGQPGPVRWTAVPLPPGHGARRLPSRARLRPNARAEDGRVRSELPGAGTGSPG